MIKNDIVEKVAESTGLTIDEASVAVNATIKVISEALSHGEDIYLRGLGTFNVKVRKPKTARNISKNTTIILPERKVIKFKPSSWLNKTVGELKL